MQRLDPRRLAGLVAGHDVQGLLPGQHVRDVLEIETIDELLGRHIGEQPPEGLARVSGEHVPDGIHDSAAGHVNDALLRAQPLQLAVTAQPLVEAADIGSNLVKIPAEHQMTHALDGLTTEIIAAAYGEYQPVADKAACGFHFNIGRRVVGGLVFGIGAVQGLGRWKAQVCRVEPDDAVTHGLSAR